MAKDYFIVEYEGHIQEPQVYAPAMYFRSFQRFVRAVSMGGAVMGLPMSRTEMEDWEATTHGKGDLVDRAIAEMDASGTDIAFVVPERFMFASDGAFPLQSNSFVIEACARYPDRLSPAPNFHPSRRGVKAAIWEMEYFAKEQGCKFFKFYPPDEVWPMNDERLWPFYAKAQELGLVVGAHTGGGGVYGTSSMNGHPIQFDDICKEFYDLKILAFHLGYPWVNEMCLMAGVYPNLYIGMSWLNRTITSRPRFFAELLGEALLYAGPDRVIWSQDGMYPGMKGPNDAFRAFQMPKDLQEGYGYRALTQEDKAKIFGLNFAKLIGIEPRKRVD